MKKDLRLIINCLNIIIDSFIAGLKFHPSTKDYRLIKQLKLALENSSQHRFHSRCSEVYPKVSGLAAWNENSQMVQLSATRCSCKAILWVSLVSFAAITLCVASQRVLIVVSVYFVMTQSGNFWIRPRNCCMHSRVTKNTAWKWGCVFWWWWYLRWWLKWLMF
jgi:hypothetical protein